MYDEEPPAYEKESYTYFNYSKEKNEISNSTTKQKFQRLLDDLYPLKFIYLTSSLFILLNVAIIWIVVFFEKNEETQLVKKEFTKDVNVICCALVNCVIGIFALRSGI